MRSETDPTRWPLERPYTDSSRNRPEVCPSEDLASPCAVLADDEIEYVEVISQPPTSPQAGHSPCRESLYS